MVLHQVEEPLFKAVLDYTQHNQSHAAAMLGLNQTPCGKTHQLACWPNLNRQSPSDPRGGAKHPNQNRCRQVSQHQNHEQGNDDHERSGLAP